MRDCPTTVRREAAAPRIRAGVLFRMVGGEAVLLETASGRYYGLNHVGSRIWSLLAQERDVESIVEDLASRYDQPSGLVRGDLDAFLEELTDRGLLELGS